MEGFAEGQITDNVEGEIICPFKEVEFGDARCGEFFVHFFEEEGDIFRDVGFEATDCLLRKGMRYNLSFTSVLHS